nr:dorsal-ventral patterning protein Sog-like [Maniola hyperantus]
MLPALVLLVLLAPAGPAFARRHAPDLREDEPARRTTRPAECQFGKQAKELGSTWYADLGPPFGVMYCIKCAKEASGSGQGALPQYQERVSGTLLRYPYIAAWTMLQNLPG